MAGVSNPTVEHDAKTRGIILHIVEQIKSKGVFDRFRRDCLEELDSKEPYRQLKQRVESHVATFLSKQTFSANLPKNQLRTSLRSNINQSEVLSKGVDRLLEQVLVEKNGSFYKEIENLVEEHLISTGHYTRYERDKTQRSDRDGQPRSEHTKLSDKEVEDIIKEETNRLLEASAESADDKSQESDRSSIADSPPPGTSGEIIEVETLFGTDNDDQESVQISQTAASNTNVDASVNSSKTADLSSVSPVVKQGEEMSQSEKAVFRVKTEENQQADKPNVSNVQNADESLQCESDSNKGQEIFAQISEPGNSTCANSKESDQISKFEINTGSNPANSAETPDVGLQEKSEAIATEVEPSSSKKNTSGLQGMMDENIHVIPEIERSEDSEPAVAIETRDAGATIGQTTITNERDLIPKESIVDVDPQDVGPRSIQEESKAKPIKTDVNIQTAADKVAKDKTKIHEPKVETSEMLETEVAKPTMVKPEVMKPEVVKPELVKVSKPSADKSRKAKEKTKAKQKTAEQQNELSSKHSTKPVTEKPLSMLNLFSTDEETDENLGIVRVIPGSKPEKGKPEVSALDIAELSDSDITVSSVHTSDLSSLEDSMSDMEFEDYQELAQKEREEKKSGESSAATGKKIESIEINEENASRAATSSKKNDCKEKIQEKKSDQVGSTTSIKTDSKEKKSGATTSVNIVTTEINEEKKSSTATSLKINSKEKIEEGKSDQAGAATSENIGIKDRNEGQESGDSNAATSKNIGSEEKSEDEKKSGQFDAASSKKIVNEEKSEKTKSGADIVKKIDSKEEHGEKKSEDCAATSRKINSKEEHGERKSEAGVATSKINSKEETAVELAASSSDSAPALESSSSSSHKHEPEPSETTESTLPASSEDENVQETSPSVQEANASALSKNIEPAVPQDSEPAGSHNNELVCAQATDVASDADNETGLEDTDVGNNKIGKRRHSRRISTERESESSNETSTPPGEQKESQPQRRSARVASKDKTRPDDKEETLQEDFKELQKSEEGGDVSRRLRRKRNSQEKTHDVRGPRSKEERRTERAEKRATRATSDSNDSDIKPSKRSKRKVRPTRCYSPSENS